jgi:transcriptional regulator with XRE-family HTH domain
VNYVGTGDARGVLQAGAGVDSGRVADGLNCAPTRDHSDIGPTVLRIIVGARLRRLREAAHVTTEDAGEAIRASHSKISRLELGKTRFKTRDVADLLTHYGVDDEAARSEFLSLVRLANRPNWWTPYGDVIPAWFEAYLGFEQSASMIRSYEAQAVPALLQTPDYARALLSRNDERGGEAAIDRRVDLLMKRQQVLHRQDPAKLWVILDEAVLHRPPGGANWAGGELRPMRAQLRHLIDVASLPHVTVQLLPFGAGGYPVCGPFTILRFHPDEIPDVVYLAHLADASYYDKPAEVDRYRDLMDRLTLVAEHPDVTLEILDRACQAKGL